jgi:hypothetical protein
VAYAHTSPKTLKGCHIPAQGKARNERRPGLRPHNSLTPLPSDGRGAWSLDIFG